MITRIETGSTTFTGQQNSANITFDVAYDRIPYVVITPVSTEDSVNVFVKSITTTGFTIMASADFLGDIHYQVCEKGD